jgi:hypothetical protein
MRRSPRRLAAGCRNSTGLAACLEVRNLADAGGLALQQGLPCGLCGAADGSSMLDDAAFTAGTA